MSNLKELRDRLKKMASDNASSRNPLEFIPDFGKTNVRLLPSVTVVDESGSVVEEPHFYHTFSYHWIPNVKRYLYTKKEYIVDNKRLKDPIDEAVAEWYKTGQSTKDSAMLKIAGTLKRKRHYYFHVILLDEPDPEQKYRVLVDRSNDGKLAKIICRVMGLPFIKDIDDRWIDKTTLDIDEDKRYFDLLDIDKGHDFRIVKVQDGENTWDISYAESFAIEKPRGLTEEERKLLDRRVDLRTHLAVEENYSVVKAALESFIDSLESLPEEPEEEVADVPVPKEPAKKKQKASSDEDIDEMLKELE